MAAIRVIFDGSTFVPQQPVTLPAQSEALVFVESQAEREASREAIRAYYKDAGDTEDESWGRGVVQKSQDAWDED